jgi:hypothetical protein
MAPLRGCSKVALSLTPDTHILHSHQLGRVHCRYLCIGEWPCLSLAARDAASSQSTGGSTSASSSAGSATRAQAVSVSALVGGESRGHIKVLFSLIQRLPLSALYTPIPALYSLIPAPPPLSVLHPHSIASPPQLFTPTSKYISHCLISCSRSSWSGSHITINCSCFWQAGSLFIIFSHSHWSSGTSTAVASEAKQLVGCQAPHFLPAFASVLPVHF